VGDLADARKGVKGVIDGLGLQGFNVYEFMPLTPDTPCVCIGLEMLSYVEDSNYPENADATFRLWVLFNPGDMYSAQKTIDEFLSVSAARSLVAAFKADPSLGGRVSEAWIAGMARMPSDIQGPTLIDWMGTAVWGVALSLRVVL